MQFCSLNGNIKLCSDAKISIDDRGLLLGDGLFETILVTSNGKPQLFKEHWQRLTQGAAATNIPISLTAVQCSEQIEQLFFKNNFQQNAVARLTVTRGPGNRGLVAGDNLNPTFLIRLQPLPPKTINAVTLHLSRFTRNDLSPFSAFKMLAYHDNIAAKQEALAAGFDDAVMLNTKGEVCCSCAGNIFTIELNSINTPAAECGALPGIMQQQVIAIAQQAGYTVQQRRLQLEDLLNANACFITNSLQGILPVQRFADKAYLSTSSPIIQLLQQRLAEKNQ